MRPLPSSTLTARALRRVSVLLVAGLLGGSGLHATVDLDRDGMSDVWAAAHPAAGDPAGDADGDGASNLLESYAGTDPLDPLSRPFTELECTPGGALALRWAASQHKNYVVQFSHDLKGWAEENSRVLGIDGEIRHPLPTPAAPARFYRLRFLENDQDSDGLSNSEELLLGTRLDRKDSDGDSLPDYWEVAYGSDPFVSDAHLDLDGDRFTNLKEYQAGTDWAAAEPLLASGPRIFWASQPVRPDETILATTGGTDLGSTAELARLADDPPGLPPGTAAAPSGWTVIPPHTITPCNATVTVPSDWAQGIYALRVKRAGKYSPARLVNLPDPWFVQGDQGDTATPGGFFIVAGNCLAFPNQTPQAVLLRAGQPAVELTDPARVGSIDAGTGMERSTGFALRYAVPAGTPAGDYALYLHNGYGGPAGWVKFSTFIEAPLATVTVRAAEAWPSTTYKLTTMPGANADERFAAALALVKANGGGRIHIPAGTYTLTQRLVLPRRTVLVGDGPDKTIVKWSVNPPITDKHYEALDALVHGERLYTGLAFLHTFALENLKLESSDTFTGKLVMRNGVTEPGWIRNTHLVVPTPPFSNGRPTALYMQDAANTIIEDSLFASPNHCIYALRHVTYIRISGSTFQFRGMNISFNGAGHNHVVYDNLFEVHGTHEENGWLRNTGAVPNPGFFFAAFHSQRYCRDLLLANNRSVNAMKKGTPRYFVGYCTDGTTGGYTGPIASVSGTTLTVPDPVGKYTAVAGRPVDWLGAVVQILGGRGAGQWRQVVSAPAGGTTITVDRPWEVEPDATSTIGLNDFLGRTIHIDNNYAALPNHQDYYVTLDSIKAANSFGVARADPNATTTEDPIPTSSATCWTGRHYNGTLPGWHLQILDNDVARGDVALFQSGVVAPTVGYSGQVGAAHVYRNNADLTKKSLTLKLATEDGAFAGALLERNAVTSIVLEGRLKPKTWADHPYAVSGVLLRQNTKAGTTAPAPINPGSTGIPAKPTGTIPGTVVLP